MENITKLMKESHVNNYIGENVSQLEHSILAAQEAEHEFPLDSELIVGAFLHDIGHQLGSDEQSMVDSDGVILGIVDHETVGANFLKQIGFSDRICTVVGNHVRAKRYLAYLDSTYLSKLSDASRKTYILQNGTMSYDDAMQFTQEKYFKESLLIRKYDELAKDVTKLNEPIWKLFDHYINMCHLVLKYNTN
jgi:putative nucleotidyltransferase with HDIG domain